VTKASYDKVWEELPDAWLEALGPDVVRYVGSEVYDKSVNRYGVPCGAKDGKKDAFGLMFWEGKGWINQQDPYGTIGKFVRSGFVHYGWGAWCVTCWQLGG
jgi:hypothetical protein